MTEPPTVGPPDEQPFDMVFVPMGSYRDQLRHPDRDVDKEATAIAALLAPLGGRLDRWKARPEQRNLTWTDAYLKRWATRTPGNSVVVWLGHGEANGNEAWLSVRGSDDSDSDGRYLPEQLAVHVLEQRANRRRHWAIVVV